MIKRTILSGFIACMALIIGPVAGLAETPKTDPKAAQLTVDDVIDRIQARYGNRSFSARFSQVSTLKALEITDSGSGIIYIKHPGQMRWEYETPERQTIVSDGKSLWVYRPDDNQVMIGKAPVFFGEGKGAGFLSNISNLRNHFKISLESTDQDSDHILKLIPNTVTDEVRTIYLYLERASFNVMRIITYNAYKDETLLTFHDHVFPTDLDDALFQFSIPPSAEVLELEE